MEIKKLRFSYFYDVEKGIYTTEPKGTILFDVLLKTYKSDYVRLSTEAIRIAPEDHRPKLKKALPFITPYGTFLPTRKKDNICHFNNSLVALDIDGLTINSAQTVKAILSKQQSTILCVISPRGCGVKALILLKDIIPLEECYNTLKLNKMNIAQSLQLFDYVDNIDNAQFNITQPMFIAFDENLYYNLYPIPLDIVLLKYEPPKIEHIEFTNVPETAKNRIEAYLINTTNSLIKSFAFCCEGNRHANIIKVRTIASWLHYAPGLEYQLKNALYDACCMMYGDEKNAIRNGVKRSFNDAWNTHQRGNTTIEGIINEIKSKAS